MNRDSSVSQLPRPLKYKHTHTHTHAYKQHFNNGYHADSTSPWPPPRPSLAKLESAPLTGSGCLGRTRSRGTPCPACGRPDSAQFSPHPRPPPPLLPAVVARSLGFRTPTPGGEWVRAHSLRCSEAMNEGGAGVQPQWEKYIKVGFPHVKHGLLSHIYIYIYTPSKNDGRRYILVYIYIDRYRIDT